MSSSITLLHAFPLDSRMWDPVVRLLRASGYVVDCIDLPGFGTRALPRAEPSLAVAARDVAARISERTAIAGVSLGGYVVMELVRMAARGEFALGPGVALIDTKGTADAPAAVDARLAMADLAEQDAGAVPALLRSRLLPGLLRSQPDPTTAALVAGWLDEADPASVAWYQRAMAARPDSLADLAELDASVLVMWGSEDTLSPEAEQRAMLEVLRFGEGMPIEDAGHLACVEQPETVAAGLARWLDGLQTG